MLRRSKGRDVAISTPSLSRTVPPTAADVLSRLRAFAESHRAGIRMATQQGGQTEYMAGADDAFEMLIERIEMLETKS
jgi:hypothetical protein